jgi:hypothetical protein
MRPSYGLAALILAIASGQAAQPVVDPASVKFAVRTDVDVPVLVLQHDPGKHSVCSTNGLSAGAPIYSVPVSVVPVVDGYQLQSASFHMIRKSAPSSSGDYLIYWFTPAEAPPTAVATFKTDRQSYSLTQNVFDGEVSITNLSWADLTDVLDTLVVDPKRAPQTLNDMVTSWKLHLIPISVKSLKVNGDDGKLDLVTLNVLAQAQGITNVPEYFKSRQGKQEALTGPVPFEHKTTRNVVANLAIGSETIISVTAPASQSAAEVSSLRSLALAVISPSKDGTVDKNATQSDNDIVIVDQPCYTVRLLPAGSGSNTNAEVEVRAHVLIPSADGHAHLRAEGRALNVVSGPRGSNVTAFAEGAWTREFSSVLRPRIDFGGVFTYDAADDGTNKTQEISGGVKGAFSLNNNKLLLQGEGTRPTLTFEGHWASQKPVSGARVKSFDGTSKLEAKFRWTQLAYSQVEGAAAVSSEKKYGGHSSYAYLNVDLFRYTIKQPMEFVVSASCGRQPPLYAKSCALRSGVSMISNP